MNWLKKILGLSPKIPTATGRAHDFSQGNSWGWACYVDEIRDGVGIKGHGFGPRIQTGDWIVLKNNKGGKPRYRITTIERTLDPQDMFFYTAVYDPPSANDPKPPASTLADDLIY